MRIIPYAFLTFICLAGFGYSQKIEKASYKTGLDFGAGCAEFHFFISYPTTYEKFKAQGAWQPPILISTHMGIQHLEVLENEIIQGKNPMHKLLFEKSEKYGLPVITHNTPPGHNLFYSMSHNDWDLSVSHQSLYHQNLEVVSSKWIECLKTFSREKHILDKDYIGWGLSNGAQWVSRVAMLHPEIFYAIDCNIPSSCPSPSDKASKIHWLHISGAIDTGYERNCQFYQKAGSKGKIKIFFLAPHKLSHGNWLSVTDAQRFRSAFYQYILGSGKIQINKEKLYVGDYVNNVASPLSKSGWIPEKQRVYFHSRGFASQWGEIKDE